MKRRAQWRPSVETLEKRELLNADMTFLESPPDAASDPLDLAEIEVRAFDGSENNAADPTQGAADTNLIRFGYPAVYPDGHGDVIATEEQPNARDVSNAIHAQAESLLNDRHLTDWITQWGQFLTHDMDLTTNGSQFNELFDGTIGEFGIEITDPNDPLGPNDIPFNRSNFDSTTGTPDLLDSPFGPIPNWREQINEITSYIDASNVYGSDEVRAAELRTFEDGKLATSADGLLPGLNEAGLQNDDPFGLGDDLFLAGDVRANEQVGLTATHAMFVREHNRLADLILEQNPDWTDEQIYQLSRKIVGAEMQIITYNEFLPALLGPDAAPSASDAMYSEDVDASITNSFATAIFRFGHSTVNDQLQLVDNDGQTVGDLSILDAFFNPSFLGDDPANVDLVLKGLSKQLAQENDLQLVDGIRNTLFGPPGAGGLDLASLDIQRGRDHGLPDYNSLRFFYGLERVTSFDEISSDPEVQATLEELYGTVDNIDAFVGALAEDHLQGSSVGALTNAVIVNQFERLRDGDRFFYTNDPVLDSPEVREIINLDRVTLSQVIQNNTDITNLQENVFFDESVLYHQVPANAEGVQLRVVANQDEVQIIDDRTDRVLQSRPVDEVSQVVIVGSNGQRNLVTIDVARAPEAIPDGIVVHDSGGSRDVLRIAGSRQVDQFVVDDGTVNINGVSVTHTGFEVLSLGANRQRDEVDIVDLGEVRLEFGNLDRDDGPGPRRESRRRRGPAPQTAPSGVKTTATLSDVQLAAVDAVFAGRRRR